MNKKADLTSMIIMLVVIFAIAIAAIIFSRAFIEVTDDLAGRPEFSNRTVDAIETVQDRAIPLLDFLIFFSFVGLLVGLIISSMYVNVHPALTFIFIIGLVVATFVAMQLANVTGEVTSQPELVSTANQFTMTTAIMGEYFPILILVTGVIVIVILYGKGRVASAPV